MEIPADPLKDLELLIRSRYGLIYADTLEEDRLELLLRHLADRLRIGMFLWSRTKGLRNVNEIERRPDGSTDIPSVYGSADPAAALAFVEQSNVAAIYFFQGLAEYLGNPLVTGKLKDVLRQFNQRTGAVVMTGPHENFPETLRPLVAQWRKYVEQ